MERCINVAVIHVSATWIRYKFNQEVFVRRHRVHTVNVVAMIAMQMNRMRLVMRVIKCDTHEITHSHMEKGPRKCGLGAGATKGDERTTGGTTGKGPQVHKGWRQVAPALCRHAGTNLIVLHHIQIERELPRVTGDLRGE